MHADIMAILLCVIFAVDVMFIEGTWSNTEMDMIRHEVD